MRPLFSLTPDDVVNFNVAHGFVEVTADGVQTPAASGAELVGLRIALIIVWLLVFVALIALIVALKSRRASVDNDGFYADVTDKDL